MWLQLYIQSIIYQAFNRAYDCTLLRYNIVFSMEYPKLYFSVLGGRECVSHLRYLHFCSVNTSLLRQLKTNASTWTRKNLEWLSWLNVAYFISFDICWLCFSFVLIECYQVFTTPSACLTYRSHRLKFTPCLLCCAVLICTM